LLDTEKARTASLDDKIAGLSMLQSTTSESVIKTTQEMEARIKDLRTENTNQQSTIHNIEKQILEQKYAAQSQERVLENRIDTLQSRKDELESSLKAQITSLTAQSESLAKTLAAAEQEKKEALMDIQSISGDNSKTLQDLQTLRQKINTLEQQLSSSKDRENELLIKEAKSHNKLKAEHKKMETLQKQLHTEHEANERRLQDMQDFMDQEKLSVSSKNSALSQLQNKLESELIVLKKQMQQNVALATPSSPTRGKPLYK